MMRLQSRADCKSEWESDVVGYAIAAVTPA